MSDVRNAAGDAIEEAVAWSLVGIVCGAGAHRWQGIGSGTLVRWRDRDLILTAAHVIAGTPRQDLRFFLPTGIPISRIERDALLSLPGVPPSSLRPSVELQLSEPIVDDDFDLAVIPVETQLEAEHPVRFFELGQGGTTPAAGETIVVAGFPFDITRVNQRNERVAFTDVEWTTIVAPRGGLRDFEVNRHFLAAYTLTHEYPAANPHGLSGSAMWHHEATAEGVWHPNLELAGVTVAWYAESSLLMAVRREVVEEFLAQRVE